MTAYEGSTEDVLKELQTDASVGHTNEEAEKRKAKYGANRLKGKAKKTLIQKFFDQFKDVMILILLLAAAVSLAIAIVEQEARGFFEPLLIVLIVVLNAVMGVAQEGKAERSLEALKSMSAPHARVIRGGQEKVIDAAELVPGDVIKLEAGDYVPADARIIRSSSLKSEESALTGESLPVEKEEGVLEEHNPAIGDRRNMLFSGCSITYGTAVAVVTDTGMQSEIGKIATMLDREEDMETPLQKRLAELGKTLGILALVICAVIFVIGLCDGMPLIEIFMTSVSLAVSAIPEGLPVIVTIVLAIGVEQMAKRKAVVKKLPAVETLGCTSIICSDKTGTLTQNKMTLMQAYVDESGESEAISDKNSEKVKKLLTYGILCCDGKVTVEDGKEVLIGDPTETSIISAGRRNGLFQDELNKTFERVAELPFDSERKCMTSINRINGKLIVITKGAFDIMSEICTSRDMTQAKHATEEMSKEALRVLAVAYKEIDALPEVLSPETVENHLTLLGLVGMIDPPREEVKDAVALCKKSGIRPIMITGDHVVTAGAIAKQLGIFREGDRAITGMELAAMSEEEFDACVEQISVYARVSPEDKIRVVKAWQKKNKVVSMTGDGVNDAPALKAADIGCAMGITGTDVAKGAADMTLMDDNFATIIQAVKQGRGIYNNLRKTIGFLLGTNIGEVLVVFFSMLIWRTAPLASMQLLWINLVTDSLPAIALGMEPIDADVMDKKPRPKEEGIFGEGLGIRIALQGMMFGVLALAGFALGKEITGSVIGGRTLTFQVLAFSQVFQAFNMRSFRRSIFKMGIFSNKRLSQAILISVIMMCIVLFIPPIAYAFGLMLLPAWTYLLGFGLALVPLPIMESEKAIRRRKEKC